MLNNLLSYGTARVLAGAGMFAAIILLVRVLEGEAYGIYGQAMVLAQVCAYLGAGWVQLGMVRIVPGKKIKARDALLANVRIVLFAALVVSALVAAGMLLPDRSREQTWTAVVVGGMTVAFGLSEYAMAHANVTGAVRHFVWINAVRYLSPLPVLLALAFAGRLSPVSAILVFATCALISGIGVLAWRSSCDGPKKAPGGTFYATFAVARQLAWLGLPALLIYSVWPVTSLINRSFIAHLGTLSDLGHFSAVSDLLNGPTVLLFQVLNWTWVANMTAAVNSGDLATARNQASEFLGVVLLLALPLGVALWFAAPALFGMLSGEPLSPHDSTAKWVAFNSIAVCVYVAVAACLVARNKAFLALIGTTLCVAATIASAWVASGVAEDTARNCAIVTIVSAFLLMLVTVNKTKASPDPRCLFAAFTSAFSVWVLCVSMSPTGGFQALVLLAGCIFLTGGMLIVFDVLGVRMVVQNRLGRLLKGVQQ